MYYSDSRRSIELDPSRSVLWLSLIGGMMLNLLPYPDEWFAYKPDFVAVVLVVWALRLRKPLSFSVVFLLGVLMDVAYTATLGQHAFAYCVLLAVASMFRRPYAIASRLHRAVFVLIALACSILASLSVSVVYESAVIAYHDFIPAAVGAALWLCLPFLLILARRNHD